jgi:hypothetical protein
VSDVQMNASTLEVLRVPERRGSAAAAVPQKTQRRPSIRASVMNEVPSPAPAPGSASGPGTTGTGNGTGNGNGSAEPAAHATHIRQGSGGSVASSDSLVVCHVIHVVCCVVLCCVVLGHVMSCFVCYLVCVLYACMFV